MASEKYLSLCESFYSVQGEGACIGMPAVFLRLAGCNLSCNGFTYRDSSTGEHLGCDSKQLWRTGKTWQFADILSHWQAMACMDKLNQGAHLVITGGEPLLQQKALGIFLNLLDQAAEKDIFIELETNGTVLPTPYLLDRVNQFNVSPKLRHSGEARSKAYCVDVLQQLKRSNKAHFKFVISQPEDVQEVLEAYIEPLKIARRQVWLMPEGGTAVSIQAKKAWLIELCKQHCVNFTTRLQVDVWNEVVGV